MSTGTDPFTEMLANEYFISADKLLAEMETLERQVMEIYGNHETVKVHFGNIISISKNFPEHSHKYQMYQMILLTKMLAIATKKQDNVNIQIFMKNILKTCQKISDMESSKHLWLKTHPRNRS